MVSHAIWYIKFPCNILIFDEQHISIYNEKVCLNFFDDILVYNIDWGSHLHHLETVLLTI